MVLSTVIGIPKYQLQIGMRSKIFYLNHINRIKFIAMPKKTRIIAIKVEPLMDEKVQKLAILNDITKSEQYRRMVQFYFKNVLEDGTA